VALYHNVVQLQALPYYADSNGSTIVIKLGDSVLKDQSLGDDTEGLVA